MHKQVYSSHERHIKVVPTADWFQLIHVSSCTSLDLRRKTSNPDLDLNSRFSPQQFQFLRLHH
ncbi:hypothetical protein V2J09_015203 [Rumex salicifolius]